MTDPARDLENGDSERRRDRTPADGMPKWVKVSLGVALALVLLLVVARLTGLGGDHGPGRHGGGGRTPPTVVTEQGEHRAPVVHAR